MATAEEIYKGSTQAAASTGSGGNPDASSIGGISKINADRETAINKMYDSAITSKTANIENAYKTNLANAQADRDKIAKNYEAQGNGLAAQYERQRRNNNIQAVTNGLNTGAGSQMQLAQSNAYMKSKTGLAQSEAEQTAAADRNISNIQGAYQADIIQAKSDNDTQRMAALLDEYSGAYSRINESAKMLAASGDFSGYAMLYGEEKADNMRKAWIAENPDAAWGVGAIDGDEYFRLTGKRPAGEKRSGSSTPSSSSASSVYNYYSSSTPSNSTQNTTIKTIPTNINNGTKEGASRTKSVSVVQ